MIKNFILLFFLVLCHIYIAQAQNSNSENLPHIQWDKSTLKQIAPVGKGYANYARMIQLHTGNLICIYETKGGIECAQSSDLGLTWKNQTTIVEPIAGYNMAVPEILELKDHALLMSYNPRPKKVNGQTDTTKLFEIRTKKSYDLGKTWKDDRLVYQASYKFEDGCWEPAQIQIPSGEIQLYFSNENVYRKSNEQNISIFRSKDGGKTWTDQPEIVSFRPGHRDGMPVPIILNGSKEILFSIEDNAKGQFKPAIVRNSLTQNWQKQVGADDAERNFALVPQLPDTVYAGAPYIRQLKNGETILSYQSTLGRGRNGDLAYMQVAIGDKEARNFKDVEVPFEIPSDKHGLWNSLCILNDDTIIAITSTNAFGNSTAVWMIKGKLVKGKD
ncbi:sialidase family protein [Pedobacter paludis]|uniref:Exo-alpha-sialidase n=1 Tax=Pedobacter paludis TaxID=2203212 RepID=A0A317EUU2_9SPHI|nr:sialidase family protein [Pedobacter paludis]PWS30202.1 hypothetical protein DF947_19780 [Pedobacter paludis]